MVAKGSHKDRTGDLARDLAHNSGEVKIEEQKGEGKGEVPHTLADQLRDAAVESSKESAEDLSEKIKHPLGAIFGDPTFRLSDGDWNKHNDKTGTDTKIAALCSVPFVAFPGMTIEIAIFSETKQQKRPDGIYEVEILSVSLPKRTFSVSKDDLLAQAEVKAWRQRVVDLCGDFLDKIAASGQATETVKPSAQPRLVREKKITAQGQAA